MFIVIVTKFIITASGNNTNEPLFAVDIFLFISFDIFLLMIVIISTIIFYFFWGCTKHYGYLFYRTISYYDYYSSSCGAHIILIVCKCKTKHIVSLSFVITIVLFLSLFLFS